MSNERYFSSDPARRKIALALYEAVAPLPLICPHGHVDPRLFAEADFTFGSPVDLLIIPDHYIFRMLYSQGIALESLGIPRSDGGSTEGNHRKVWRIVCENWHLFTGTPTGIWLRDELREVFSIDQKMSSQHADSLYDQIAARLSDADFKPRTLYDKFNIEVLTTTDPATSRLEHHAAIRDSGWGGRILPTFRPDAVINMEREDWRENIRLLAEVTGIDIGPYTNYIRALEQQREAFKAMGATATDHAALTPYTEPLSLEEAEAIFQRGLFGVATEIDTARFGAHMLIEMARMSSEDGLVMQLHVGSHRDHNPVIYQKFGRDMGADMPITAEFTRNLKPLLDRFGNHPNLTLILFNLDESTYSRELAPLAGHYPILKLGPPWWFYDSINGMIRFLDGVVETAGLYNTAGFNDDTRAFASIPARHDLWRRISADWLADLVARHIIDEDDAREMIVEMAYGLAKRTYKL
jgi:glucuronate isomerase